MLFEPTATAPFPVRLEADYPERLSRLSTLLRIIIPVIPVLWIISIAVPGNPVPAVIFLVLSIPLIPLYVVLNIITAVALLGVLIYWIAALVRGRPVRWLFDAIVAIQRFTVRAYSYFFLLTDRYPPFDGEWQVRYEVDCPERLSRWRLVIWKTVTVIPHAVVLAFVYVAVLVVVFLAWFAVLFTGRYPAGMYHFVSGWLRWAARAWAYWASLTDEFPSFSLSGDAGPAYFSSYVISAIFGWLIVLAWVGGISAVMAWPGQTKEVAVSYEQLLQGEGSDVVDISDLEVTLLRAQDPYEFFDGLYVPEEGDRFVIFVLRLSNERDSDLKVREHQFRLEDSDGDRYRPFLVTLGGLRPPVDLFAGGEGLVGVIFELDEDAQPTELRYTPGLGFKQRMKFLLE
jgi:hypothetical protein